MKKEVKEKVIEQGTLRIKCKDLKVYRYEKGKWAKTGEEFSNALEVIKLFKAHGKFDFLKDTKNSQFIKGQVSRDGKIQGARINTLPDGQVLDKAYSLFAKNLVVHDENSLEHWDAMYENQGGGFAHLYTIEKIKRSVKGKYKEVDEFAKRYQILREKVLTALKDKNDNIALPMYTLLQTYMRVGNEIYFKTNGHKGLTTLKKKDVSIKGKNVEFNYIGKKGVPMDIIREFPSNYINRLKSELKILKDDDFIFTNEEGRPLKDTYFMDAFEKYCGKRFYPHIVRSFYATQRAKEFLKSHKVAGKDEVKQLFMEIAEKLGHKKFDKKNNEWKSDYNMTIHYYLQPEIVQKINDIVK